MAALYSSPNDNGLRRPSIVISDTSVAVDLIDFSDFDGSVLPSSSNGHNDEISPATPRRRKLSPDMQRILASEIRYFERPIHVPTYTPDDFFRSDGEESTCPSVASSVNESVQTTRRSSAPVSSSVSCETSPWPHSPSYDSLTTSKSISQHFGYDSAIPETIQEPTLSPDPPEPPARSGRADSDLADRLKKAGILVADTIVKTAKKAQDKIMHHSNSVEEVRRSSPVISPGMKSQSLRVSRSCTTSPIVGPKSPRATAFDDYLKTQSFETQLKHAMHQKEEDFVNKNLEALDVSSNENLPYNIATHETRSLEDLYGHHGSRLFDGLKPDSLNLKSLSVEDLIHFESKETSSDEPIHTTDAPLRSRPPPRPPPPKNNRFSCPAGLGMNPIASEDTSAIFFGNGMFELAEERNEEAVAFCEAVAELRKLYMSDDHDTNSGYVSAPTMKNNCLSSSSDTTIGVTFYLDPLQETKEVTCYLTSSVNEVIALGLAAFQGNFSDVDILSDQYVLKPCGYAMYMSGTTILGDYLHVQDCINRDRQLRLVLLRKTHMNVELCRDKEDDETDSRGTYFKHYFEVPASLSISQQGLTVLLDAYNTEAAKLIADVGVTYEAKYMPERLIQTVKAISNSLATIETTQIQEAINILLSLKGHNDMRRTYSLNPRKTQNFNRYINPMHFDKGRFHLALEKLTAGVHYLIELYCEAFNTNFTTIYDRFNRQKSSDDVYERIDALTLTDRFSMKVSSVHRIPKSWHVTYDFFEFECGLFYGGKLICPAQRSKAVRPCIGFFEHISFEDLLVFNIPVKDLPREAKLGAVLRGISTPKKGSDGRTVLGWFSCKLYGYQGFLVAGGNLFGLLSNIDFNPAATCATNYIQNRDTVIAKMDFQLYHTEVVCPEPILLRTLSDGQMNVSAPDDTEKTSLRKALACNSEQLTKDYKKLLWKFRYFLCPMPRALPCVLSSIPDWTTKTIHEVHNVLTFWEALKPQDALELLQADYPDRKVRETAVFWLSNISTDDLLSYLPELVQALKYEHYHNSSLARFLIKRALEDARVAHFLFWHLKYYTSDMQFCQRFQIVLGGLLSVIGARMRDQLSRQDDVVQKLTVISQKIKETKESNRKYQLLWELESLNKELDACLRVPVDPSLKVSCVAPDESSYFSSFTVPLKVVFRNVDPRGQDVDTIFKVGDDLRKDLVTLLLFRVMNKLWLLEGLDLKMIIYEVLPTGPLTGMIEIVHDAATFREIHVQYGLTGSFKDDSLMLWLEKFSSSETKFDEAVRNFTASAAAYCVATYILGIGDRHNDNIMVTKNGHLFHIDFSKFMGNVQKFGNIKRDRVPFVLTPDMAYVINRGIIPTANFQQFIDYCCQAFNIIRKNYRLVLNLLGLMVHSGISYLSQVEDLDYVRDALQLHLSDGEATIYFTRLIESSLSSRSTQLNFFIHNVAQMKNLTDSITSPSSGSGPLFSFSNKVYSMEEDGEIESARVVDFQKRYSPEKHYVFVINIVRKGKDGPMFVFRKYEHFQELHNKLGWVFNVFNNTTLPELPPRILLGRSQIREVAFRRRAELDRYMHGLSLIPNVFRSEIFYTFCHNFVKDVDEQRQFSNISLLLEQGGHQSRISGEIKLSLLYSRSKLRILVMHVRGLLPRRIQGLAEPYVKTYLLPDPTKSTKRKTKVLRKTLNPTYNESLIYEFPLEHVQRRVLQVSVWDHDGLRYNEFLGGINFYLSTFDLSVERTGWFKLEDLGLANRNFEL